MIDSVCEIEDHYFSYHPYKFRHDMISRRAVLNSVITIRATPLLFYKCNVTFARVIRFYYAWPIDEISSGIVSSISCIAHDEDCVSRRQPCGSLFFFLLFSFSPES